MKLSHYNYGMVISYQDSNMSKIMAVINSSGTMYGTSFTTVTEYGITK